MSQLKFRSVRFQSLFITQFLGAFNDNFFKNALVILLTYQSVRLGPLGAQELVAIAGAIFILPYFLFSASAGALADLYQKRQLIILTKWTELFVMALAVLGFWLENYLLLLIVLFLMGVQSTFFGPLKYGVLPDLVGEKNLVRANSWVTTATFTAILLGTIVGGLSAGSESFLAPLSIGLLLVSGLGILSAYLLPIFPVHGQESTDLKTKTNVDWSVAGPTCRLMMQTMKDKKIFFFLMSISWFWFLGAGVLSLLPVLVKDILRADENVATVFLALFTVGMGLGAGLSEKIGKERPELGLPAIAAFFMSISLLALGLSPQSQSPHLLTLTEYYSLNSAWGVSCALLFFSICGGAYIVPLMSAVQKEVNVQELSRVIAGNNVWNALFMVAVSLVLMAGYSLGANALDLLIFLSLLNVIFSFYLYIKNSDLSLRVWGYFLAHLFYRIKVIGRDYLPDKGPYIILSNHVSFIDWLIIFAVSKHPVRFVIDHNYYFKTGLPFWLKQAKLIPIATRKEKEELMNLAFERIKKALDEDAVVGIFPEGMITHDGEMRRFQPGVSRILKTKPVTVVPIVIKGLYGSNFSRSGAGVFKKIPSLRRRRLEVQILAPIEAKDFDLKQVESLMRESLGTR